MIFVKEDSKKSLPELKINSTTKQLSAKLSQEDFELAQEVLKSLTPAAQEVLKTNEDGTITHKSFLGACFKHIADSVNIMPASDEMKSALESNSVLKQEVIDLNTRITDLESTNGDLKSELAELKQQIGDGNADLPDGFIAVDPELNHIIKKDHPWLQDFFKSLELRAELKSKSGAAKTSSIEEFIYQLYYNSYENSGAPAADGLIDTRKNG